MAETFIGEPLIPEPGSADASAMAAGGPGVPQAFVWRGKTLHVDRVLDTWTATGPCRHGSGERYVRKHWFIVQTAEGPRLRIYCDRHPAHGRSPRQRWRVFAVEQRPGADAIDATWYDRPPHVEEHVCAGGVVVRRDGDRILVALAHQTGYNSHILPKGHVEEGEDIEAAARREIHEEAGFTDLRLLGKLGVRGRLDYSKQCWKQIHYFLYLTGESKARPTDAPWHPAPTWHELNRLPPLFWPDQQDLLNEHREHIRAAVLAADPGPTPNNS